MGAMMHTKEQERNALQNCARAACQAFIGSAGYTHKHLRYRYCRACALKINAACPGQEPFDLTPVRYDLKALAAQDNGIDYRARYDELTDTPPRYVIYSEEWGVYVGNCMGMGFFSGVDPVGQPCAVTFASEDECRAHVASWDGGAPPKWRPVAVACATAPYATIAECVAAGLPAWSAE